MQARPKIVPWLNLAAGLAWIWIALRNFDRLSLLDGYGLAPYRGIRPHPHGEVLMPCVAGLLFLIVAALGFLKHRPKPEVTTLLSGPRS